MQGIVPLLRAVVLILSVLVWGQSALAENQPGERSLQSIHDEFMGYAQEYYDEAKHWSEKASRSHGGEQDQLREVARLSREMGDLKVEMAKGFLHDDHASVKRAEKQYYSLSDQRESIFKKLKGH